MEVLQRPAEVPALKRYRRAEEDTDEATVTFDVDDDG